MTRRAQILFLLLFVFIGSITLYSLFESDDDLDDYAENLQELIDTKSIASNMELFAANPHRAGTPANHQVGERIIQQLQSAGARVWTTEYFVDLPEPGDGSLMMTTPVQMELNYSEKSLEQDPYTSIAQNEKPYFAYIPDTALEGEVVYANFGDRKDYDHLKQKGINVAGKIALVRTQGSCRGMKQMVAEEEGLAGLLLFPEPKDQGFKKPPYPDGPSLNPWVAQRGSMLKFFMYPGDPTLSTGDQRENTLPTVPALPITPAAAKSILQHLKGDSNEPWRGWMDVTYATGPGPASIQMRYKSERKKKKIRNIFATLGGLNSADPVLMISTHYDAWIYGAADPSSGSATIVETAKALFALEKQGWKPHRNIVFAFWDAEEYGMIGSTRWVLNHLPQVRGQIGNVLYVDSVRGPLFRANLLPGLRGLLDEVLTQFTDPNTGKLVRDFHLQYDMPGFSDDTIPFSNFAGVPVTQLNYGVHYTMYHSIYDNLQWMQRYGDPGYLYLANLARIVALYSIVLSSEDLLPFRFAEFAAHYEKQLSKIRLEKIENPERIAQLNEAIRVMKEIGQLGEHFNRAELSNISVENKQKVNKLLLSAILNFTDSPGKTKIPFRKRNILVGPSAENECAGTDLPGIRRAVDANRMDLLTEEMDRFQKALVKSKQILQEAAALVESQ